MSKQNEVSLTDQIAKLDEVVAWFEQDDFDIDAAIAKFEEGAELADDIKQKLSTLENKITILKKRFDAAT